MKNLTALFILTLISSPDKLMAQSIDHPNIILIIVDDLNDYTEFLGGHPQTETPGMLSIAANGIEFTNAQCPSPKCAPSRTSFMTGKDCEYTTVYSNPGCQPFRDYFHGQQVFTLPEYLKDSVGYYTIGINKIYHCFDSEPDFDTITTDPCARDLSWNRFVWYYDGEAQPVLDYGGPHNEGLNGVQWSRIPDSLEKYMYDYTCVDSALEFINGYEQGTLNTCGNPLFIAIGMRKPHTPWYIPEHYFADYYLEDIYDEPFEFPYNHPSNQYPYNGIVMAPQPNPVWSDYYALPTGGVGQYAATFDNIEQKITDKIASIPLLPVINDTLTDDERISILEESKRANATIAYLASIKFVDAQIGRLYDSLLLHPAFLNNSIIILIGDNGYSLGEKKHWGKGGMWETDMRVPFVIADMRNPAAKTCNQTVSLLDIFPTVCDMIDVPYPVFTGGTDYLDGKSLMPLLIDPNKPYEHPALGSYQLHSTGGEGCFPIYSVRSNDFHFLHYHENSTSICTDTATLFTEQELYEIGINRDLDPNEWNNVVDDSDYAIVKKYLQQWLPDSAKYLQSAYVLSVNGEQCTYQSTSSVSLAVAITDPDGNSLSEIPFDKHIVWFTNLSNDSSFTDQFIFSLADITSIDEGSKILVYTVLYNSDFAIIEGLQVTHIIINNDPDQYPKFSVKTKKRKTSIINVVYPPSTISAVWNYSDGYSYTGFAPPLHKFLTNGTYTITCTATIDTSNNCSSTTSKTIVIDNGNHIYLRLFPNPSVEYIYLEVDDSILNYHIEVYNSAGTKVLDKHLPNSGIEELYIQDLPEGFYIMKVTGADFTEVKNFTKVNN